MLLVIVASGALVSQYALCNYLLFWYIVFLFIIKQLYNKYLSIVIMIEELVIFT